VRDDSITVLLGLPELRVRGEEETDQWIGVRVEYRAREVPCPWCGEMTGKVHSRRTQMKRDMRLWQKPVYLELRKRRWPRPVKWCMSASITIACSSVDAYG